MLLCHVIAVKFNIVLLSLFPLYVLILFLDQFNNERVLTTYGRNVRVVVGNSRRISNESQPVCIEEIPDDNTASVNSTGVQTVRSDEAQQENAACTDDAHQENAVLIDDSVPNNDTVSNEITEPQIPDTNSIDDDVQIIEDHQSSLGLPLTQADPVSFSASANVTPSPEPLPDQLSGTCNACAECDLQASKRSGKQCMSP